VTWVFPDAQDRKLKLGEPANVLLGFYNKADQMFNVTGIGASLQNPHDTSYYIQNFTARRVVGVPVGPGQQASVEYQFRPDAGLEAGEYWMSAWVIYNNSADQVFMHTFYNGTVELHEESRGVRDYINFVLVLGLIGLAAYAYITLSGGSKPSKKRAHVERGTRVEEEIQIYKQAEKSKGVPRRKQTNLPPKKKTDE